MVLAIIALIATPIVMNTIKNAKKGAAERTADNYIKQVETTIAEKKLENNPLADGPYTIDGNGNLAGNGLTEPVTIEMSGNKPTSGTVTISNGMVSKDGAIMKVGDFNMLYSDEKFTVVTIVYRNTTDEIKIGTAIDLSDTTKYTANPSTIGKSYYLKHLLDKDNKITKSYACTILKGKEYCLTSGQYKYPENENDYIGNALVLRSYQSEGVSCEFVGGGASCIDGSNKLLAYPEYVLAGVENIYCGVKKDGTSFCG